MKIAGFQKTSLMDYKDEISSIIFTQGCNLKCGFCHNHELIAKDSSSLFDEKVLLKELEKRKDVVDHIVITGGEPLLQPDIFDFLKKLKGMNFKIKLDTNGMFPKKLREAISLNLIDYVAMDLKTPDYDFKKITGSNKFDLIRDSINILESSDIDFEYRTTVFFDDEKYFLDLIKEIAGTRKTLYLQQFLNENSFSDKFKEKKPTRRDFMEKLKGICDKKGISCELRYYD